MPYSFDTLDDFRVGYDYVKEWTEGRGLFLLLAMFLGGVGGGAFIASAIVDWKAGLAIALILVAVGKGTSHLADLGHPMRAWMMVRRVRTSWISRGFWFMMLFLIFGTVFFFFPDNRVLEGIACFWGFWLVIYSGFEMASATGISFWNSALLPVIFVTSAVWSGACVVQIARAVDDDLVLKAGRLDDLTLIAGTTALIALMSFLLTSYTATKTARKSMRIMTSGQFAIMFWTGVVTVGFIIPIVIFLPNSLDEMGRGWLAMAGSFQIVGSFFLIYCLLRVGLYPPVL